jgi:NAD+ diphosphatase
MMTGFTADGDDTQPIRIDRNEISDAVWFPRDNLPEYPPDISIAGEMIDRFKKGEL